MVISITNVLVLSLVLNFLKVNGVHNDEDLELLFNQRSFSDWKDVWHQESHSRCRDKLLRHLYWACEKDIYRLARRNGGSTDSIKKRGKILNIESPWIDQSSAQNFLRTRRKRAASGVSITHECCTRVGCTWEEYAEYCPSNKRKNHFKNK